MTFDWIDSHFPARNQRLRFCMKYSRFPFLSVVVATLAAGPSSRGEERTLTPEQLDALAQGGDLTEEVERPGNLPDLTKGEPLPPGGKQGPPPIWTLGPTGIVSQMIDWKMRGDQILVKGALKGSPAEGKFLPGDVLLGMNGEKFKAGGHLGLSLIHI